MASARTLRMAIISLLPTPSAWDIQIVALICYSRLLNLGIVMRVSKASPILILECCAVQQQVRVVLQVRQL